MSTSEPRPIEVSASTYVDHAAVLRCWIDGSDHANLIWADPQSELRMTIARAALRDLVSQGRQALDLMDRYEAIEAEGGEPERITITTDEATRV